MTRLTFKQQQKIVLDILEPYFNDFSFTRDINKNGEGFIELTDFGSIHIIFHFTSSGHTEFSLCLSYFQIEEILMRIGGPSYDFSKAIQKGDFSNLTIYNKQRCIDYDLKKYPIINAERAEKYAEAIIIYMEKYGWAFIQQYSSLPNVLTRINQLETEGKYWHMILCGQADYFLRGLLIAKLCSDPEFERKLAYVNNIFFDPQYNLDMWLPYYDRFIEKLSTISPKFNDDI